MNNSYNYNSVHVLVLFKNLYPICTLHLSTDSTVHVHRETPPLIFWLSIIPNAKSTMHTISDYVFPIGFRYGIPMIRNTSELHTSCRERCTTGANHAPATRPSQITSCRDLNNERTDPADDRRSYDRPVHGPHSPSNADRHSGAPSYETRRALFFGRDARLLMRHVPNELTDSFIGYCKCNTESPGDSSTECSLYRTCLTESIIQGYISNTVIQDRVFYSIETTLRYRNICYPTC
jgi:hypothetical protein